MAPDLLPVLMALRVKRRVAPATLAAAAGLSEDEVGGVLEVARGEGIVCRADDGWALSDLGRAVLAERLAVEPIDRARVSALYPRFLALDVELKAAITAWQLAANARERSGATSDLLAAGEAAVTVANDMAAVVPRLRSYAARLTAAVRAVGDGAVPFVASPRVDSLHQVWFELHEDLLVMLGRSRTS